MYNILKIPPFQFHLIFVFANERELVPDHFLWHVTIGFQAEVSQKMNQQNFGLHMVDIHSQTLPTKVILESPV